MADVTRKKATIRKAGGNWKKILLAHGSRMTNTRLAILELIHGSNRHLNAKEIYIKIGKEHTNIGLTTVYRNLNLFERLRLINKYEFGGGTKTYEIAGDKHHSHLVCTGCGKVIDCGEFLGGEAEFYRHLKVSLSTRYNFEIHEHDMKIYGLCPSCK